MSELDLNDRHRIETHHERAKRELEGHQNHPKDAWEVVIDVYLNSVGPAPDYQANFDIQTCLPTELDGIDPNPHVYFFNEGRPGFNIMFRLFDNTNGGAGSNYRFPKNKDDAVWSQLGETCPTAACDDVFPNKHTVVQDATTLVVFNPNQEGCLGEFRYTLNVSIGGDAPYVHLDPGGNNMNGGIGSWR
jgi:hypothetical protein